VGPERAGQGRGNNARALPLQLGLVVIALVFLVALGSSRSLARIGGPSRILDSRAFSDGGSLAGLALVIFAAAVAVATLVVMSRFVIFVRREWKQSRNETEEIGPPPLKWWQFVLLLLGQAVLFGAIVTGIALYALGHHTERAIDQPPAGGDAPAAPSLVPDPDALRSPSLTTAWITMLVLALAVFAGYLFVRRLRRRRLTFVLPAREEPERTELRVQIERSLAELESEPDPRRAVIGAYVGMEQVLERRGFGRRPFETPLEYLARALGAIRVSQAAVRRLTALFEWARFSQHAIGVEMKKEALVALGAVRDELEGAER